MRAGQRFNLVISRLHKENAMYGIALQPVKMDQVKVAMIDRRYSVGPTQKTAKMSGGIQCDLCHLACNQISDYNARAACHIACNISVC